MEEQALTGGRTTAGIVRIGDTVRRPPIGDAAFRRRCLRHFEATGFVAVPRFLGIDAQGREMLSFVPGAVPDDLGHYDDGQLRAAARLLRSFHDASAGMAGPDDAVACHNDWGPANTVFRDARPVAMIDFDTLAPGPRAWDLGYSAFTWLDLGNGDYAGSEQRRRLALFAAAYGHPACGVTATAIHALARQTALAASADARGLTAIARWAGDAATWTALHLVEPLVTAGYPPPGAR